jgi:HlyD family secretion protein
LVKGKLIPESDFDTIQAELEQREATVKIREANLKSAQVDLARTKIYSPIDGTVISRNIDVGQTVQASFSAPTLFNIANDLSKMEIAALVSEADIGNVEDNQEVNFTVEAFPARNFRGHVTQVRNQPSTNQNVVNYATIVEVKNPDLKLKPGMTATVTITTAKKENALKMPNSALRFRPPEEALIKSNAVAGASKTNAAPRSGGGSREGRGGGGGGNSEMRQKMLERFDKNGDGQLDETERAAMRETFQREGGPSGMGRRSEASPMRTVYLVTTNAVTKAVELEPAQVKVGISDGAFTEIVEGLKEGDVIAAGVVGAQVSATAQRPQSNPFGGPFGGGGGGSRR